MSVQIFHDETSLESSFHKAYPVYGEVSAQLSHHAGTKIQGFDDIFIVSLNKLLNKLKLRCEIICLSLLVLTILTHCNLMTLSQLSLVKRRDCCLYHLNTKYCTLQEICTGFMFYCLFYDLVSINLMPLGHSDLTHWSQDTMATIFTNDIFQCIFLNEKFWILNKISLKYFLRVFLIINHHWFR